MMNNDYVYSLVINGESINANIAYFETVNVSSDGILLDNNQLAIYCEHQASNQWQDYLGRSLSLLINDELCFHGILIDIILAQPSQPRLDKIILASLWQQLSQRQMPEIWLNKSEKVIWESLLKPTNVNFTLANELPQLPLQIKYNEDDLHFLRRRLAYNGCFATSRTQKDGQTHYYISDTSASLTQAFPSVTLAYQIPIAGSAPTASILAIQVTEQMTTEGISLRDRNLHYPRQSLHVESGQGYKWYHYGDGLIDQGNAKRLAKARCDAYANQPCRYHLITNATHLQAGQCLKITGHAYANGEYFILSVRHFGSQARSLNLPQLADIKTSYYNQVTAIPWSTPYRSLPLPYFYLTSLSAHIASNEQALSAVDKQGYYALRFAFSSTVCPQIPVLQKTGSHLMHLPLQSGTEVAVGFLQGDINRPFIIGALSNPQQGTPVTEANQHQHILRTPGGQQWLVDDAHNKNSQCFSTENQQQYFSINQQQINVSARQGDLLLQSGGGQYYQIKHSCEQHSQANYEIVTHDNISVMAKKASIRLQAGEQIRLRSEQQFLTKSGHLTQFRSSQKMQITAGQSLTLSANSHFKLTIPQGKLQLHAGKNLSINSRGGIKFSNDACDIAITPWSCSFNAENIYFACAELDLS